MRAHVKHPSAAFVQLVGVAAGSMLFAACTAVPRSQAPTSSVSGVLASRRGQTQSASDVTDAFTPPTPARSGSDPTTDDAVIATVNGRPIERARVVDLLLASHGVGVLEQLVVLDLAEEAARTRGIVVTRQDVIAERDRALRQLVDPLASPAGDVFDREQAERLLDRVLSDRNVSHAEFGLVMRRNTLLRKLVLADRTISDEELKEEFERANGPTATIRHIQLATLADVARVQERLANGGDFAELAKVQSANLASAQRGGLLDSFTRTDDRVPEALRAAAFSLEPGGTSGPIRVGEWYHLVKLERRDQARSGSFDAERDELERRLRARIAEPAMRALYEKLFDEATIRIHDPVLDEAFRRVHPDRSH